MKVVTPGCGSHAACRQDVSRVRHPLPNGLLAAFPMRRHSADIYALLNWTILDGYGSIVVYLGDFVRSRAWTVSLGL